MSNMRTSGISRVFAIDAVRGFAIFAMVVAHTAPYLQPTPRPLEIVEGLLNDVAAPLFALVIGVTISLTAPSAARGDDDARQRWIYRAQTGAKALVLIALGFLLEFAPSGVNIVLDYLGIMLLTMIPLLFLRTRSLLIVAGALLAVGPGIVTMVRQIAETTPSLIFPRTIGTRLLDWFVLGVAYQVLALLAMGLIGMAIGRSVLRDRRAFTFLFWGSVIAFIPFKAWKMLDLPGSEIRGGYAEVLSEAALAIGVFSFVVLVTDLASSRVRRTTQLIAAPLVVQGRMALSIYVFHVLVLMEVVQLRMRFAESSIEWFMWPRGLIIQLGVIAICWMFAAFWWRWIGIGPVERLLGVVSGRHGLSSLYARNGTSSARAERTAHTEPAA